ncbi:PPC domain-containing DNA-binding protein [Croceibacterium ferulae]|uniref:PPC domain-containing DNA-binding protein n=1 Tax=Croceibacterium ferulae TaxID=1854641 RepID=UPI0019D44166|nr:PPC domain-containing DNA-binding protein [Croceibacterium ferulae]
MGDPVRHLAIPAGFLMVLQQGDDVLARLEALIRAEDIPLASITGFGFAGQARFGFFDFDRRDYDPREFEDLEIAGLTGTLAWMDGEPSLHVHASGGDRNGLAVVGHVLELTVGRGSFEITIIVHPHRLQREVDSAVGAKVLQLRQN